MKQLAFIFCCSLVLFTACDDDDSSTVNELTVDDNFTNSAEGWTGGFADYSADQEEDLLDLRFEYTTLPAPLDTTEGALLLCGTNVSDDLFMFITKEVTGLTPNARYAVTMDVTYASDVPDGQVGIGGSPGESVFVKAGASPIEPQAVLNANNFYRMNIDKGNQAEDGADARVIGNFANGTDQERYTLLFESLDSPIPVTANDRGSIWLIVGTDSGFEGRTTIYYNQIEARISR